MAKVGRPTKIDKVDMELLEKLYRAGLSDEKVSEILGITRKTIYSWRKANKEFLHTIKDWKAEADEKVERSLYERACGYEHEIEELFFYAGKVIKVNTIKKYPPSEIACFFWLKNRNPEKWRDKPLDDEPDEKLNDDLDYVGIPTQEGNGRFKRFYN